MIGIYKITSPSGRIYIGQSNNIKIRKNYYNTKSCKKQTRLYNSIVKYGWINHIFEVIEECLIEELNLKERYWQDYYNVLKTGLNCKLTKTDDKSAIISEETREKLRISHLGYKHKESTKQKMSENRKGKRTGKENHLYNKKQLDSNVSKILFDEYSGIFYYGFQDAADNLNMSYSALRAQIKGYNINKTKLKIV